MKISSEKTVFSDDVINSSIKSDKLFWRENLEWMKSIDGKIQGKCIYTNVGNLQTELLIIRRFSLKNSNSGENKILFSLMFVGNCFFNSFSILYTSLRFFILKVTIKS